MVTQMDLFNRLLEDHAARPAPQFGLALASAVLLLVLWEVGKLIARGAVGAIASATNRRCAATAPSLTARGR